MYTKGIALTFFNLMIFNSFKSLNLHEQGHWDTYQVAKQTLLNKEKYAGNLSE